MWHALLVTRPTRLSPLCSSSAWRSFSLICSINRSPGRGVQSPLFLPYITSTVASAAVWSYVYSPDNGLLNAILQGVGLQPLRWLAEPMGVFALIAQSFGVSLPIWHMGPASRLWRSSSIRPGSLSATTSRSSWPAWRISLRALRGGERGRRPRLENFSPHHFSASLAHHVLPVATNRDWDVQGVQSRLVLTQGGPGNATTTASVLIFQQMFQTIATATAPPFHSLSSPSF